MAKLFDLLVFHQSYFFYEIKANHFRNLSSTYNEFFFKEIMESDFKKSAIFKKKDRMRRYLRFVQCGHRCFGFFDQSDNVVSYLWLSTAEMVVPFSAFAQLKITNGLAYIWDCRTADIEMGKGLYKEGLKRVIQIAAALNASRIKICNLTTHDIANKTMVSLKFECSDCIRLYRFLLIKIAVGFSRFPKLSLKNKLTINIV